MRDTNTGNDERGNMERLGESAGSMAGRAADFGMEMTGAFFRSAAEMLGGWWSSEEPGQAADSWNDTTERSCRTHYQASAGVGASDVGTGSPGLGATQATNAAPKSTHASMEANTGTGGVGRNSGGARFEASEASDGFERAKPGYQLGYVARRNPAYRNRSFSEVEPELKRVWETRAKTEGGTSGSTSSWPEVRGFVDFAYQQDDARR